LNGEAVELLPFDAVMRKISRSKSPHLAEFQRYDFRFNPISREWKSLDELRQIGVCLEDPMLQRVNFVNLAAVGDSEAVGDLLLQGFDPNGMDYSGSTALHLAAANRHSEVVELLVKAGGDVNSRDKNVSEATQFLFVH
jgi:ankyrin repeat protein